MPAVLEPAESFAISAVAPWARREGTTWVRFSLAVEEAFQGALGTKVRLGGRVRLPSPPNRALSDHASVKVDGPDRKSVV